MDLVSQRSTGNDARLLGLERILYTVFIHSGQALLESVSARSGLLRKGMMLQDVSAMVGSPLNRRQRKRER
jgi:hypothetical protein